MSAPKSLAGYPEWFFTIAERAMKSGYKEELPMDTRGACINLRQRFYKFRQLLTEAGHPHAAGALSLTLTIEDKTLRFSQLGGLSPEAAAKLALPEIASSNPANAPDRIETSDAAEELLNRMLGRDEAEGRAENMKQTKCAHEWNQYDVCLRCGKPRDDGPPEEAA